MARYAAESQKVSATNLAHADEPGYKAMKVESFEEFMQRAAATGGMDTTRIKQVEANTPSSPNGNTVSLDHELYVSADAMGQHNLAITVYEKSLDLMRTALGKGR
ncbi:MAG: flagellar biosynthesis protein FlgB [Hyphomonas sp.]|nr:flagellar biosynthesis protein FlgB [Hyphomonas sp.]